MTTPLSLFNPTPRLIVRVSPRPGFEPHERTEYLARQIEPACVTRCGRGLTPGEALDELLESGGVRGEMRVIVDGIG